MNLKFRKRISCLKPNVGIAEVDVVSCRLCLLHTSLHHHGILISQVQSAKVS